MLLILYLNIWVLWINIYFSSCSHKFNLNSTIGSLIYSTLDIIKEHTIKIWKPTKLQKCTWIPPCKTQRIQQNLKRQLSSPKLFGLMAHGAGQFVNSGLEVVEKGWLQEVSRKMQETSKRVNELTWRCKAKRVGERSEEGKIKSKIRLWYGAPGYESLDIHYAHGINQIIFNLLGFRCFAAIDARKERGLSTIPVCNGLLAFHPWITFSRKTPKTCPPNWKIIYFGIYRTGAQIIIPSRLILMFLMSLIFKIS